jgi:hypothetical protein
MTQPCKYFVSFSVGLHPIMFDDFSFLRHFAISLAFLWSTVVPATEDFTQWQPLPATWQASAAAAESVTLHHGGGWAYLVAPGEHLHVDVSAQVTIDSAASQFSFFGSSWSAWPDSTFSDQGFEAGLLLRTDEKGSHGYRVQVSHKYQQVALVRFPDGGYLASVQCEVKLHAPIKLRAKIAGNVLRVSVDDKEVIHYVDRLEPAITTGRVAIGVSSNAKVSIAHCTIQCPNLAWRPNLGFRWR